MLHLIHNTFRLASRRDRDIVAKDLRPVYTAVNQADAQVRLGEFNDTHYLRPAIFDDLRGDDSKATALHGWRATTTFVDLVHMMVDADRAELGM